MVSALSPGGGRAVARCDALGLPPYSDMEGGLYRGYLMPAYHAAQDELAGWMAEAGMHVRCDGAANLIGRYEGTRPDQPALVIGSHLDSVRDAGRYDGALGIMLGIELVASLRAVGRRMTFPIEVYAFGDEEGSRFPAAMLTSRAVAGTLEPGMLDIADASGIRLEALLDTGRFAEARHKGALAYLEAHIEQGPVLEAEGLMVGNVTGIAAQRRYAVTVRGVAGHAGTTAMRWRRDALAGAAAMILAVEHAARADRTEAVATVGVIEAAPGAPNVIAGEVRLTIDVRAATDQRRDRVADEILALVTEVAETRQLSCTIETVHDLPASPCDPVLMDLMDRAIDNFGLPVRRLVSGAGHDAMIMAKLCPTAMLFIRCRGGVSHNPAEQVDAADAEAALQVMRGFVDLLGETCGTP